MRSVPFSDRHQTQRGLTQDAAQRQFQIEQTVRVELRKMDNLVDARLSALVEAVNVERIAGFPSGRLFLDSVEQALAAGHG